MKSKVRMQKHSNIQKIYINIYEKPERKNIANCSKAQGCQIRVSIEANLFWTRPYKSVEKN
jgi:hypothetical protein